MTDDDKATLRQRIRATRRARPDDPGESAAFLEQFTHLLAQVPTRTGPVAAYLATATEPPTDAILESRGVVLVPRACVDVHGQPSLEWVPYSPGDDAPASALGIREPTGTAVGQGAAGLASCSIVLVPSLATDRAGRRLGQGGGYYDRVLAGLPAGDRPLLVAMIFDDEILDDVRAQSHDCRVDAAITPRRCVRFT